jgi:hypothetical protein
MLLVHAMVAAACSLMARGQLPDSQCTSGAVQSTNAEAICTPGWASRHRHVTAATRRLVYRRYGLEWEVDHRVPLELGGSNRISNLSPEHHPKQKDGLENRLHQQVCSGRMRLRTARVFLGDWRLAFGAYLRFRMQGSLARQLIRPYARARPRLAPGGTVKAA